MPSHRAKICFVVTEPMTVQAFLLDHFRALSKHYDLTLVTNSASESLLKEQGISGRTVPMRLARPIRVKRDLVAMFRLYRFFRTEKFDCIHSITPKAGILSALAGKLARVPMRLHTFTGQVWVTRTGLMHHVLRQADKTIATLNSHLLVDSSSQRDFLVNEHLLQPEKSSVLGFGSISGVDLEKFRPNAETRVSIREREHVSQDAIVFLFVGRLTEDKGIRDLLRAFADVKDQIPEAQLWIVGPDEQGIQVQDSGSASKERVRFFGPTDAPEQFMAAADVLCLPSYREGFGSVVIEAAAAGIPALVSRIYGLTDAVEDGVTGLFHAPHDAVEIADRLLQLASDKALRERLGHEAQLRASNHFSKESLTAALVDFYAKTLGAHMRDPQKGWRGAGKRVIDFVLALTGLIILAPVLAAVALLIRVTMGSPVLFKQLRPGKHGKPFRLVKFRTMIESGTEQVSTRDDERRLTKVGSWLRNWSLDELPQLWNVLRGEMSLVGPRPLLMQYLEQYTPEQARRHDVKPGITGWAQIHGRNAVAWEKRFELDVWYVDHWSLWLDIKTLWMTLMKVVRRDGISQQGHATMPEFICSPSANQQHE